jgi:hypothetical protein
MWLCRSRLDEVRDEGGESRPDQGFPSPPGSTVPSPKIAAVERRKAMRFRTPTASPAVPEAKQDKVRLAALHAPHCCEGKLPAHLAHGARTMPRGCLKIESG